MFNNILLKLTSVTALFGIFGNTLVFVGFHKNSPKTSTSYLFKVLAVADNLVLVSMLPYEWLSFVLHNVVTIEYDIDLNLFVRQVSLYMYPICCMSILGSICVTTLLAVTRVIAVYFPLHASRLCSIIRIRVCLGVMAICTMSCNLPLYFEYWIEKETYSNVTYIVYIESRRIALINICIRVIFYSVIPLSIITATTILLIVKLRSLAKRRRQMTSHQRRNINVTRLLVAVLSVFLLCSLPYPIATFIYYLPHNIRTTFIRTMKFLDHIRTLLYMVNSSVNCLIYTILSKEYRKVVTKSIKYCLCRHPNSTNLHEQGNRVRNPPEAVEQGTTHL